MLRQAAWDRPRGPPTAILQAFDTANLGLQLGAAGTAVVAHLHHHPDDTWSMTWTNAGHPPPILLAPDGTAEVLAQHDVLFGFPSLSRLARTDHTRNIPEGATLFLYTDGLVERRGQDIDTGIDALLHLLRRIHSQPVQNIVDTAIATLAPDAPDDVVALAVRFNFPPSAPDAPR